MAAASARFLAFKGNIPLAAAIVTTLVVFTVTSRLLMSIGKREAWDNRGVADLQPDKSGRVDLYTATQTKQIDSEEPILIFVAEGGGIHALYRAANVLGMIETEIPGTWERMFATSTVSGGSMGTALFASVYDSMKSGKFPPQDLQKQVCLASNSDFLTPVLARMTFSEPLGAVWPYDGFDRAKALEIALESATEKTGPNNFIRKGLSTIDQTTTPYFCFNTLSATFGDRLVLSNLKLPTVRTLADYPDSQDVTVASAAGLSARFPVFPGGGRLRLTKTANDRLLDGGIYDNSGLMTAFDLIAELRRNGNLNEVVLIVVGNNMSTLGSPTARHIPKPDGAFAAAFAFLKGGAQTLYAKNTEVATDLRRMHSIVDNRVNVINFVWDFDAMNAPLGWYLDEERQQAISWLLGAKHYWTRDGKEEQLGHLFPEGWEPSKKISALAPRGDFRVSYSEHETDKSVKVQLQQMRSFNRHELQRLADIVTSRQSILDLD